MALGGASFACRITGPHPHRLLADPLLGRPRRARRVRGADQGEQEPAPALESAGQTYGVPWQVLAAINKIESNFGQNMGPSSAGAIGWMQFVPSTWARYGMDASGDGKADPYNAADAIYSAARYLSAAGAHHRPAPRIYAYNHAQWYVDQVLQLANLFGNSSLARPRSPDGPAAAHARGRDPGRARAPDSLPDTAPRPRSVVEEDVAAPARSRTAWSSTTPRRLPMPSRLGCSRRSSRRVLDPAHADRRRGHPDRERQAGQHDDFAAVDGADTRGRAGRRVQPARGLPAADARTADRRA